MAAYLIWGWQTNSGLYAAFVRLQYDLLGSQNSLLTIIFLVSPLVVLPILKGIVKKRDNPPSEEEMQKANIKGTKIAVNSAFVGGLVCALVSYGAYSLAGSQSDEVPTPVLVDVATADDALPDAPIYQLQGSVPDGKSYFTENTIRASTTYEFYIPVVPDGYRKGQDEIRFIQNLEYHSKDPPDSKLAAPGSVSNSKLPILIQDLIEKDGHKLADSLYIVTADSIETMSDRDTYWMVAALAGVFGFLLLMFAVIFFFSLLRLRRLHAS